MLRVLGADFSSGEILAVCRGLGVCLLSLLLRGVGRLLEEQKCSWSNAGCGHVVTNDDVRCSASLKDYRESWLLGIG